MGPKKIYGQKSTLKPSDVAVKDSNPGWAKLTGGASKLGGTGGYGSHGKMTYPKKKMTYPKKKMTY